MPVVGGFPGRRDGRCEASEVRERSLHSGNRNVAIGHRVGGGRRLRGRGRGGASLGRGQVVAEGKWGPLMCGAGQDYMEAGSDPTTSLHGGRTRESSGHLMRRGQEGPGQWPGQRGGSGFDGLNEGPRASPCSLGAGNCPGFQTGWLRSQTEPGTRMRTRAQTHTQTYMHMAHAWAHSLHPPQTYTHVHSMPNIHVYTCARVCACTNNISMHVCAHRCTDVLACMHTHTQYTCRRICTWTLIHTSTPTHEPRRPPETKPWSEGSLP